MNTLELGFEPRLPLDERLHELALDLATQAGGVALHVGGERQLPSGTGGTASARPLPGRRAGERVGDLGRRRVPRVVRVARVACSLRSPAHASAKRVRLRSTRKRRNRGLRTAPRSGFTIAPVACTLSAAGSHSTVRPALQSAQASAASA